jgi:hypothetical protein
MRWDEMKENKIVQRLLASSWSPCSLAIKLEPRSKDRMLSIDVLYVTIADAVKIAQFFQFLQGYSLWFSSQETVDPQVGRRPFDS